MITSFNFRKFITIVIDLCLIWISMAASFLIRFDWQLTQPLINAFIYFSIWASLIKIILFDIFGVYQWSFRFASINEAINIVRVCAVSTVFLIIVAFFTQSAKIGRSVLLIDFLIYLFLVISARFLPRILVKFNRISRRKNLKKVLIVGAGSAGEMVARELMNVQCQQYDPVGFIDDNPVKMRSQIHGIKVLGGTKDIAFLVKKCNVEEIIIAVPSASGITMREIVSKCEKAEVKIKTVPEFHKILTGEVTIKQIRDVEPEDLMGRKTVQMNSDDVNLLIKDKRILVTGAGGTIGSELCRQIVLFDPKELIMYDYNENDIYFLMLELKENFPDLNYKTVIGDIKDISLLKHTFSINKPQVVFHSAAHKHVPLMEDNPISAVKNNIIGTRNLMYAAEHYGVESFVMISTDKAVNPTSVMGASKRIAEMMIQAKSQTRTVKTKFMAVRFGNVIGSSGSVVPIFKRQIEKGGPVTVTDPEVKRFFMASQEAAQLVLQAGAIGRGGEIFILDMGEQIKISDLAKNLITLSGFEPGEDIEIKFTGLRPGEKMHEEMLLDAEHDKATRYDKIYIAQPEQFDPMKLRRNIKSLERLANFMDSAKIIRKIKEMVPTYNSTDFRK
ncbi:MAG: nucleoside-diphosphate sugar epimerase/dehydratase [Candidatus Omnitrophota bacterium]